MTGRAPPACGASKLMSEQGSGAAPDLATRSSSLGVAVHCVLGNDLLIQATQLDGHNMTMLRLYAVEADKQHGAVHGRLARSATFSL